MLKENKITTNNNVKRKKNKKTIIKTKMHNEHET